jgi:hypothetical protein
MVVNKDKGHRILLYALCLLVMGALVSVGAIEITCLGGLICDPNPITDVGNVTLNTSSFEHLAEFSFELSNRSLIYSDFTELSGSRQVTGAFGITAGVSSSITGAPNIDHDNHPGVWRLDTGTDTNGRVFIISESLSSYHVGVGGITRVVSWVRTEDDLSDGTDRYTLRSGFFSMSLPNVINEGIGFEYVDNENSGRWQLITHNGSETSSDSGITVVADTWYKLSWQANTDGTSVDFFIDDVLVGTHTTNIPSGTTFSLFYNTHIMKLAGTTDRSFYIDAYYVYKELTR